MQTAQIEKTILKIVQNIEKKGFERYDVDDIINIGFRSVYVEYAWRFAGIFFPMLIRKILGVEKSKFPTAYTHVAEALLLAEQNSIHLSDSINSVKVCEEGLRLFFVDEKVKISWQDRKYNLARALALDKERKDNVPTMNMHCLARFNILLLKLGVHYNKKEYVSIAYRTALETMKNHKTYEYPDGSWSIAYFYHSDDCTLNVNTEFAQWLSMLPAHLQNDQFCRAINGIVKLMIREQNDDGSWYYFSKEMKSDSNMKAYVDCHHTGTVLANLVYVLKSAHLDNSLYQKLLISVNRGFEYYITNFFDPKTGKAPVIIGYRRPAMAVQYSEAVLAFCEYCLFSEGDTDLKKKILLLLPKIVNNMQYLVKSDGSASGENVIKPVNIDSIRWGNGPVLQALISYLILKNKLPHEE